MIPIDEAHIVAIGGDTLRESWQEYARLFVDRGVPASTIELVRHGYYVGALATFLLVIRIGNEHDSADDAARAIDALRVELDGFAADIAAAARAANGGASC